MAKLKNVKKSLISSVLTLVVSLSMLVGATFAWFTDAAVSSGNKIVAGKLDVELYLWTATEKVAISTSDDPIFGGKGDDSLFEQYYTDHDATIWEPGKTEVVYLSIANEGQLDLKYKVAIEVEPKAASENYNLCEVMQYEITPDAKFGDEVEWTQGVSVKEGTNETSAKDVTLKTGEEHFFALAVHMDEDAAPWYMGKTTEFDIKVLAGQLASEADYFGSTYDELAAYPGTGFASVADASASGVEIRVRNENGTKVGSVVIPTGAVADGTDTVSANIKASNYKGNFTVAANETAQAYDISVEGLQDGNTVPVKVQLRMEAGLDPATVKLYHKDVEIDCTYNPETGYVTFETATFSPFTVVFDANSVYVPPVALPENCPTASVIRSSEYENTDLDWGSYGVWSPTAGLDSRLEAAYTFSCNESLEEAKVNPFANWYCDFYVMLDQDLGANEIFLGGNYGSFGWVGFHNGELTLPANEEIPLLGSVTSNPWTYLDVVQNVGTFICGVGDVGNKLSGATFTVMLRLTNPDDPDEYYNVARIEYKFA
ncbi:MAG: hypothetical protein IJX81_06385 [Clostridia bacterium]|nr:hypothetical protein [Clostridia bacterium]